MRHQAILQTLVEPGEEHTTLAGLPTEASIRNAVEEAIPGFLQNVRIPLAAANSLAYCR